MPEGTCCVSWTSPSGVTRCHMCDLPDQQQYRAAGGAQGGEGATEHSRGDKRKGYPPLVQGCGATPSGDFACALHEVVAAVQSREPPAHAAHECLVGKCVRAYDVCLVVLERRSSQ